MTPRNGRIYPFVMILLLLSGASRAYGRQSPGAQAALAGSHGASTPRLTKRALLIGIDHYKYPDRVSPLAGSLNDVEAMRGVLIGKFEFAPENITVLKDAQATHAGIMNAIQADLIEKTQPGDIVVVHYSGHGSQMKDVTGKRIGGVDETIVPYDSRDPDGKVFDISGAELHAALVQLAARTKNLTFILDSCHSGSLVRGARIRSVLPDERSIPAATAVALREVVSAPAGDSIPKFAFISAATSKESAFEHYADGSDHGALTYFLTRQLAASKAGATYRDVMDPVMANVTGYYPAEHPALEGAEADQAVFGDGASLAGAYVVASPSSLDATHVTLNTGMAEGATIGSAYDVYAPGSRKFAPPEHPISRVQILSVQSLSAEASVVGGGKVPLGSRAVEHLHRYESPRIRVYLDDVETSPQLQALRASMQAKGAIQFVDQPARCNIQLRTVGQSIQTLAPDLSTLSGPLRSDDPQVVQKLSDRLQLWAKWFNVFAISNPHASIDLDFTLATRQTRDAAIHVGKPNLGITEGEQITANLLNNSDRDLYISILDLASDGSVSIIYPAVQGSNEVLKSSVPFAYQFSTFVPKGRSTVTDVIKLFASYKPLDLSPLRQGSIGGATRGDLDPLQELLDDSDGGTRNVAVSQAPVDLSRWTTKKQTVLTRHK